MRARSCALAAALAACAPGIEPGGSALTEPAIIAVVAEPAEVRPGERARYTAVVAGPPADTALTWSFCDTPRPLAEEGAVDPACFQGAARPIATATSVEATLPIEGCRTFGPDPPPGDFRARDPDPSGGFYQPVLISGLDPPAVFGHRIRCGLPRASADVARAFEASYVANQNPVIDAIEIEERAGGAVLTLRAPDGEAYPRSDPSTDRLEARVEALVVTWHTDAGTLSRSRTRPGEPVTWTGSPPVTWWAVLRDDRGGSAVASAKR